MFKDMLKFLGLNYRDASLKTLYLVVLEINFPRIGLMGLWMYGHSGKDYRVAKQSYIKK